MAQRLGVANDVFNGMGKPGLIACHAAFGFRYGVVNGISAKTSRHVDAMDGAWIDEGVEQWMAEA
jgi:hypothetical protein